MRRDARNEIVICNSVGGYFPVWYGECLEWLDDGTPIDWYSEELTFSRFATEKEAIDYVEKFYPVDNSECNYYGSTREWNISKFNIYTDNNF